MLLTQKLLSNSVKYRIFYFDLFSDASAGGVCGKVQRLGVYKLYVQTVRGTDTARPSHSLNIPPEKLVCYAG